MKRCRVGIPRTGWRITGLQKDKINYKLGQITISGVPYKQVVVEMLKQQIMLLRADSMVCAYVLEAFKTWIETIPLIIYTSKTFMIHWNTGAISGEI